MKSKGIPIKKILIIKPSALGDIVHTLPFLASIRKCFPAAEIHWLVARGLHTFLDGHPMLDRLWIFDRERWRNFARLRQTFKELLAFRAALRREKFDVSVDLSGLLRSGLITWAAGATLRLGFKDSNEGSWLFYNRKIPGDMSIHAVDRYLKFADFLGCDTSEVHFPFAPYEKSPPVMVGLPDRYAVMVPSAGKEANRWPAERFGGLAARLAMPIVLLGSSGDAGVTAEVARFSGGWAIDLAGKTSLKELIPIIEKAAFMVTNDTGPMHIAAALQVPVYAIFGPANPARTGPYGDIHTVIRTGAACSPCYRWKPCENWRCMEEISVDLVSETIKRGQQRLVGQ